MSDRLLYTISTHGALRLDKFDEIFAQIYKKWERPEEKGAPDPRRELIRLLDSLGHCEFDYNRRKIYVCPPTLTRLPLAGLPKAALTGARSPKLVKELLSAARKNGMDVSVISVPMYWRKMEMPSVIIAEASNINVLNNLADAARVGRPTSIPAASRLASFSVGYEEIKSSLSPWQSGEPNWPMHEFDNKKLSFWRSRQGTEHKMSLCSYTNSVTQEKIHLLWVDGTPFEVERDWGRYLYLNSLGLNVLIYCHNHFQLAVPVTLPLPLLFARSLTLCTAILPFQIILEKSFGCLAAGQKMLVYTGVSQELCTAVTGKLGQLPYTQNDILSSRGVWNV